MVAQPRPEGEKRFKRKHTIRVNDLPSPEYDSEVYTPMKDRSRLADYQSDMDELVYEKKLDPVGKADDDIDNDGDVDDSDKYLKNRRKAISKAIKNEDKFANSRRVLSIIKERHSELEENYETVNMIRRQMAFIHYASEELMDFVQEIDIEEWFQNKIAQLHGEMQSLYAYARGEVECDHEDEEDADEYPVGNDALSYYGGMAYESLNEELSAGRLTFKSGEKRVVTPDEANVLNSAFAELKPADRKVLMQSLLNSVIEFENFLKFARNI